MTTTITVAGRIATATATTQVVAGNTYPVALSLDSEWTGSLFMRVRFGSLYYDIPFASTDATVDVQFPVGYPEVGIGIFSEALQVCTNEVRVKLLRSILEAGEQVVEFDGDLYDQWEGEVTALLTDDAFDATSIRPVQNAVITAWKDTVALDANVVHNTGNETIAGAKTFTSNPTVTAGTPTVFLKTDSQSTGTGIRARIRVTDAYSEQGEDVGSDTWGVSTLYDFRRMAIRTPDRASEQSMEMRSYQDHIALHITPYYPEDGDGNPQALPSDVTMTSGNVAVDPRLVHTTGAEAIAGAKTFQNGVDAYPIGWNPTSNTGMTVGQYAIFAEVSVITNAGRFGVLDFFQSSNTSAALGSLIFKCQIDETHSPAPMWVYRKATTTAQNPLGLASIVMLYKDGHAYLAWKKEWQYGTVNCRIAQDISYGSVQSKASPVVRFIPREDMTILDSLNGYTVFEAIE